MMHLLIGLMLSLWPVKNDEVNFEVLKMPQEFIPGKPHVIILKITNNSEETIAPKVEFNLPKSWKIITRPFLSSIAAGKQFRLIYSVALPSKTPAGTQKIGIDLEIDGSPAATKEYDVSIKKINHLEVEVYEVPSYVRTGADFKCQYIIKNKGNVLEEASLYSKKGIIISETAYDIPVDSFLIVTVSQKIDQQILQPVMVVNNLTVTTKDSIYTKNHPLRAYPGSVEYPDIFHRYPIKATFLYSIFENTNQPFNVLQYNLKGKGFLDKEEKHFLEVALKGTNRPDLPRFENFSRYGVSYSNEKNSFLIGDFSLSVSRLLEQVRIGRGVWYARKLGKLNTSIFYNAPTFFAQIKDQIGSTVTWEASKNTMLKWGSILRNYPNNEGRSFATGVSGQLKGEVVQLEGEYAMSLRDNSVGMGTILKGALKKEQYQISTNLLLAQAGFEGYFNNSTFVSSSANIKLSSKIATSVGANYALINPKVDTIFVQSFPFNQSYFVSLNYLKSRKHKHGLSARYRSSKDRSEEPRFDYEETSFAYRYQYSRESLKVGLRGAISNTHNKLTMEVEGGKPDAISLESSLDAGYKIFDIFSIGTNVEYSRTNRYDDNLEQYLFYGFLLNFQKDKLSANMGYRNNYPLEEQYQKNSFLNANVQYRISNYQSIAFTGRFDSPLQALEKKDFFLSFKYNINLNIPLSRDKNLGNLLGNLSAPDPEVRDDVIINLNGLPTLTDINGLFEFKNFPAGDYYLTLEEASIKKNYVVAQDLPYPVRIEVGQTATTTLDLILPIKIEGEVIYKRSKQIQSAEFESRFPQLIIKLEKGDEVLYTLTNDKNKFIFAQLRPGKWKLSVVDKGFEKKYEFPDRIRELTLESGKTVEVTFEVKDKKRRMNFKSKKLNLSTN